MSPVRTKRRAAVEQSSFLEEPPPASELFTPAQIVGLYPHILSNGQTTDSKMNRLRHALRNRRKNGLMGQRDEHGRIVGQVVFESPLGHGLLIHGPGFVRWLCGLKGLSRPRKLRTELGDSNGRERVARDSSARSAP